MEIMIIVLIVGCAVWVISELMKKNAKQGIVMLFFMVAIGIFLNIPLTDKMSNVEAKDINSESCYVLDCKHSEVFGTDEYTKYDLVSIYTTVGESMSENELVYIAYCPECYTPNEARKAYEELTK